MTLKELKEIIDKGRTQDFALDPNTKSQITKATIDGIVREANKHLVSKKRVWVILVKE